MNALLLAHAGHWAVGLLYLAPLLIVVGMLSVSSLRDRRAEAADGPALADEPPESPPHPDSDDPSEP